jgi:hypothetical protein
VGSVAAMAPPRLAPIRTDHHLGYLVSRRDSQATIVAWKIYGRVKIGAG